MPRLTVQVPVTLTVQVPVSIDVDEAVVVGVEAALCDPINGIPSADLLKIEGGERLVATVKRAAVDDGEHEGVLDDLIAAAQVIKQRRSLSRVRCYVNAWLGLSEDHEVA